MFDREDLRAAVVAEVIGADQAARLERWMVARKSSSTDPSAPMDGENLRFITNLNDIFITIGLAILFAGVATLLGYALSGFVVGNPRIGALALTALLAALAWVLSEYFCLRRRLLLPSMFLVLAFTVAMAFFGAAISVGDVRALMEDGLDFNAVNTMIAVGYGGLGAGALAAIVHYFRFRLPFTFALIAILLSGVAYVWAAQQGEVAALYGGMVSLLTGLACLAAGIWFDMHDPERVTRSSDNAFWLHLVSAPQIIFGLRGVLNSNGVDLDGTAGASLLIATLIALAIISVAINRRALIAASIITFAGAVSTLMFGTGQNPALALSLTALIVGGGIVLLGAGWKTARKALLSVLPKSRIFPPETL